MTSLALEWRLPRLRSWSLTSTSATCNFTCRWACVSRRFTGPFASVKGPRWSPTSGWTQSSGNRLPETSRGTYKLLTNSVFGKTMENLRKRVDVKLIKMKDECAGRPIAEYAGLRPKMYSILEASGKSIKKAKGMKKNTVKKHIRHEQYKEALFEKQTFRHGMDILRSERHHIYRQRLNKVSLSPFNQALDRRKWGGHTGLWAQRCNPCKLSSSTLCPMQDPIRWQLCVRGHKKKFLADESPLRPILQVVQHRLTRLGHRAPKLVNRQSTATTAFQLAGLVQIANANTWRELLLAKANRTAWNSGGGLLCHRSCLDGLRRPFAGEPSHFSIQGRNDRW